MLTVPQPLSVSAASATARRRRLDVSARAVIPAEAVPLINCVDSPQHESRMSSYCCTVHVEPRGWVVVGRMLLGGDCHSLL